MDIKICTINYAIKILTDTACFGCNDWFWVTNRCSLLRWLNMLLHVCNILHIIIYSIYLDLLKPRKNTGRGSSGTYAFTQSASKKLCIGTCKASLAKSMSFSQVSHTDSNGKNRFWMVFSILCPSAPSRHIYLSLLEAWSVLKARTITVSSVST